MSETIRRRFVLGAALALLPFLAVSPAVAYHGDPDREDFPGQQERTEQEREQRERAEQEREEVDAAGQTVWSIAPALADEEDAANTISMRMEIEPGASVTDAVTVTNFSNQAAAFVVYASDGVVTTDGQFDVLPASSEPTGAGSWMSVGEGEPAEPITVEIEAGSDATVPFVIDVPPDATPGDYPVGIVAALAGGADGVGLETRVGTRIHLRVAGDLEPALAVSDVSVSYEASWNPLSPGVLHLEYRVENTGNVRLGDESEAHGASLLGLGERSSPGTGHREILPGHHASGAVTLENVWPLLRYSGEIRTVPLVVGDDVIEVPLAPGATPWSAWTLPWMYLAAFGLVVGGLILRRRARKRHEARTQARIQAAVSDARNDGAASRVP